MPKKRKGLLIVFEGSDGSGKATQAALLSKRLDALGYKTETLSFPDYNTRYGKKIAAFLRGEYGTIDEVSPYFIAKLFAGDRKLHRKRILSALEEGKIVILDRYVSSNLYQAAKLKPIERKSFIRWMYNLEYSKNRLPKEDISFYLSLPVSISQRLVMKKKKRQYLKSIRKDIQEKDILLQKAVKKVYGLQIRKGSQWKKIECSSKGRLLSKGLISDRIFRAVKPLLKGVK